jgi:hypothetical protein
MSAVLSVRRKPPSYVHLASLKGDAANGVDTSFAFTYPNTAIPYKNRRIVGCMVARRNTDLGITLSRAAFSNGSGEISATIHAQDTDGDGSANNSVLIAFFSAIVPTNDYNQLIVRAGGSFSPGCYSLLGLYDRNTLEAVALDASHSSFSSRSASITNAAGERVIVAAGGFSGTPGGSWNLGTELDDYAADSGGLFLSTAIHDRAPAQAGVLYTHTFTGSLTASGAGAMIFS